MLDKIKQNKAIIIRSIICIILICCAIMIICQVNKENNCIELKQFAPTTQNQMMGYGIRTKNGKLIIVDGGKEADSTQLAEYIKQNGGNVSAWFITHIHSDHFGALSEIVKDPEIQIDKIYISYEPRKWYEQNEPTRQSDIDLFFKTIENKKMNLIETSVGEKMQIDNATIEILKTKNTEITQNAINNSSMVFKVKVNDTSILFLGDIGTEASNWLIENCSENQLKSDIVQVAHHGQKGATEELYKKIQAKKYLWPTTYWLWYNDSGAGQDSGTWETLQTKKWLNTSKNSNVLAFRDSNILKIY